MTQDEIIEMARQAGLDPDLWNYTDAFEVFAKLVAAKERDECAKVCEDLLAPTHFSGNHGFIWDFASFECADAIRARDEA